MSRRAASHGLAVISALYRVADFLVQACFGQRDLGGDEIKLRVVREGSPEAEGIRQSCDRPMLTFIFFGTSG